MIGQEIRCMESKSFDDELPRWRLWDYKQVIGDHFFEDPTEIDISTTTRVTNPAECTFCIS